MDEKLLMKMKNELPEKKIAYCYGDFPLDQMKKVFTKVKFLYYNCSNHKPSEILPRTLLSGSIFQGVKLIYIFDNVDILKKKDIEYLTKLKDDMDETSKCVILLSVNLDKNFKKFPKYKLGVLPNKPDSINTTLKKLMSITDPNKKITYMGNIKYPIGYIFGMLAYNLPYFYRGEDLECNADIITLVGSKLFKVKIDKLITLFCYSFINTTVNRNIKFPLKKKKEKK